MSPHSSSFLFQVVGYIDLSDSEDETSKTNQKKSSKNDSVIEILSSEEETERIETSNKPSETPKKRRGRPRKNPENNQSLQKEDDNAKTNEEDGKYFDIFNVQSHPHYGISRIHYIIEKI